jgi:hypothetical protein
MSGTKNDATKDCPEGTPPGEDCHTAGGAPKDQAHLDAGDGTLTGSVPAGLSSRELRELAESDKTDNSGTG